MKLLLANPRGFCAGVDRAIATVARALDLFPHPIYVRHEVVHNQYVVNMLKSRGAIFVEELDEVPDDSVVIFSAHGVAKQVEEEAERRGLKVFDASCPLVKKVHMEVASHSRQGRECILIGHRGHPEVLGTVGQFDTKFGGTINVIETATEAAQYVASQPNNLAYVTQTTLSMDDTAEIMNVLKERFPSIKGPRKDDICYATQNRQNAVKQLVAEGCDLILVVGSANSSNSNRLCEVAERCGAEAYRIESHGDINTRWLEGKKGIGLTAGASAPDILLQDIITRLVFLLGVDFPEELAGIEENISFPLPAELRIKEVK